MSLQSIVDICRTLDRFSDSPTPKAVEGHYNTVVDLLPKLEADLSVSKADTQGMERADEVAAMGCVLRLKRMLEGAGLWAMGFQQQVRMMQGHRTGTLEIVSRTMQALRPILAELEPLASRAAASELLATPKAPDIAPSMGQQDIAEVMAAMFGSKPEHLKVLIAKQQNPQASGDKICAMLRGKVKRSTVYRLLKRYKNLIRDNPEADLAVAEQYNRIVERGKRTSLAELRHLDGE